MEHLSHYTFIISLHIYLPPLRAVTFTFLYFEAHPALQPGLEGRYSENAEHTYSAKITKWQVSLFYITLYIKKKIFFSSKEL